MHNAFIRKNKQRLKSSERRPEVNRLNGQWAQWLIGFMVKGWMVDRLDSLLAGWSIDRQTFAIVESLSRLIIVCNITLSDIHKAIMRLWKSFISMTSFISAQFYSHKDLWYVTKTPVCRVQTIEWFRKNLSSCVLGKVELQQPRHHHEPSDKESNSNKEMFLLLLSLFHRIFTRVGYTNKSNQTIDIFLCL